MLVLVGIVAAIAACDLSAGIRPYPCPPLDSVNVHRDPYDLNCQLVGKLPDTLAIR